MTSNMWAHDFKQKQKRWQEMNNIHHLHHAAAATTGSGRGSNSKSAGGGLSLSSQPLGFREHQVQVLSRLRFHLKKTNGRVTDEVMRRKRQGGRSVNSVYCVTINIDFPLQCSWLLTVLQSTRRPRRILPVSTEIDV